MIDEGLPEPLTPAHVDLRDRDFMPLKGHLLFNSVTWLKASAEAKVAALRLWWHAYSAEVPAASLPDDDTLLSEYAGYGVAVKAWGKVKPSAMRGWIKCSDGRWHHPVLAEIAAESWEWKQKALNERAADRARKIKKTQPPPNIPPEEPPPIATIPPESDDISGGIPPESNESSGGIPVENRLGGEGKGRDREDIQSPPSPIPSSAREGEEEKKHDQKKSGADGFQLCVATQVAPLSADRPTTSIARDADGTQRESLVEVGRTQIDRQRLICQVKAFKISDDNAAALVEGAIKSLPIAVFCDVLADAAARNLDRDQLRAAIGDAIRAKEKCAAKAPAKIPTGKSLASLRRDLSAYERGRPWTWPVFRGLPPDDPGCDVPIGLLIEFGFREKQNQGEAA